GSAQEQVHRIGATVCAGGAAQPAGGAAGEDDAIEAAARFEPVAFRLPAAEAAGAVPQGEVRLPAAAHDQAVGDEVHRGTLAAERGFGCDAKLAACSAGRCGPGAGS